MKFDELDAAKLERERSALLKRARTQRGDES
jgi:hypothetical protein